MAALLLVASPAAAEISATTSFETSQLDQLSLDPFEFDERMDGDDDSISGVGTATVSSGSLTTFHQRHSYETFAGANTNFVTGRPVHLFANHRQEFSMDGFDEESLWRRAEAFLSSQVVFLDQLTLSVAAPGTPALATVEYVWQARGSYTQIIDIRPDEQPLYRLEERISFTAGAGGFEEAPVINDVTFYDRDAEQPNPPFWSVLDDDVNLGQPIPDFDDPNQTLIVKANLETDDADGYLPIPLGAGLVVESTYRFLNDGPSLNFFLRGETEINFSNSADLLGIIVRDVTGAIRTDVTVDSTEGVVYPLLVPEPAVLLLSVQGILMLPVLRRCRPGVFHRS